MKDVIKRRGVNLGCTGFGKTLACNDSEFPTDTWMKNVLDNLHGDTTKFFTTLLFIVGQFFSCQSEPVCKKLHVNGGNNNPLEVL